MFTDLKLTVMENIIVASWMSIKVHQNSVLFENELFEKKKIGMKRPSAQQPLQEINYSVKLLFTMK